MSCIYLYNGHQFESEAQLDSFLLSNGKLVSKYGDIVFNRSSVHNHVIDILNTAGQDSEELRTRYNNAKISYQGEECERTFEAPFVGVNDFLSGLRNSEGKLLFPEFIAENYWKDRFAHWKAGEFNDDEKELFFDNPDSTSAFDESQCKQFRQLLEEKWKQQGQMGEEVHKVLQLFFSTIKTGKNAGKLTGSLSDDFLLNVYFPKQLDMSLIPQKAVADTLKIARALHKQIVQKFGDNCTFFPEFVISGKTPNPIPGKGDTILGKIDLLVVDDKGNTHIIDYKTSPKPYEEYNAAKELAFTYQIAVYNRLLASYGIRQDDSEMLVVPLQLDGFRKEGDKFVYDGIKPIKDEQTNATGEVIPATLWTSVKNRIEQSFSISSNLDEFFPLEYLDSPVTEDVISNVRDIMSHWCPNFSSTRQTQTDESIKQELEEAGALKPNENNVWSYSIGKKEIIASSESELFEKVKKYKEKIATYRVRSTKNIIHILKRAIEEETSDLNWPKINSGQIGVDPEWFRHSMQQYCNHNWKVIEEPAATEFGIILLQNRITGQIDVIRISPNNLDQLKHFGGKDRSGLSGAFQSDIVEHSNSNSLMLAARAGNIELMETMLVINNLKNIFNKQSAIGNIIVTNPFYGNSLGASNEELLYCFKVLDKFYNVDANGFKSGEIQLCSRFQLAANLFKDIMTSGLDKSWSGEFKEFKHFETCLSMFELSMDENKEKRIEALEKLTKEMEKHWDLRSVVSERSQDQSKHRFLYNQAILALAQLRGATLRQQVQENDAWLESAMIFTKGISGLKIDNPGNLSSMTLNLLTGQTIQVYQNVRSRLQAPIADFRKLLKALKEEKGFGGVFDRAFKNETNLYSNMYRTTSNGDWLFKNVKDSSLSKAEKDMLEFCLWDINKNRFPFKTDEQLEEMKNSDDVQYYRVPLTFGDFASKVSEDGMMSALKNRLKGLSPKEYARRMRERAEGIQRVEEQSASMKKEQDNTDLFEMGVQFDRGEGTDRIDIIKKRGLGYFEHNLETLYLKHRFQYLVKEEMDKVFPMMKAAMIHLIQQGNNQNTVFENDLKYLKDYINNKIKNKSLIDPKYDYAYGLTNELKKAATYCALAGSPVQAGYQAISGIWNTIRLVITKPDIMEKHGKSAFTFSNVKSAFFSAYRDLFVFGNKPTKNSLINELYALNDMDMNTYVEKCKQDQYGLYNFNNVALRFSQRPDFYNRLTIFGAQMRRDGSWEAHSVVDGKLVYDWTKDKRFDAFAKGDTRDPRYNQQKALYIAMAKEFESEGALMPNGEKFVLNLSKRTPLPRAYTTKQSESYKSLADDIYGYYAHEKKALFHSMWQGSMLMQFRTYWTGKKNQYFGKSRVGLQGEFVQKEENGQKYYYVVNPDGTVDLNNVTTEDTGVPVMVWKGKWQEGIALTMSRMFDWNPVQMWKNYRAQVNEEDPMLRQLYRANRRQLMYDLTMWFLWSQILAGLLAGWMKELKEDKKDSNSIMDAMQLAGANMAILMVKNSFADLNMVASIADPLLDIDIMSLSWAKRMWNQGSSFLFGDNTTFDLMVNSFSVTRAMKPGLDILRPDDV